MNSDLQTEIKDKYKNNYLVDKFIYEIDKNLLKLKI